MGKNIIKLLVDQRRVGKATILRQIMDMIVADDAHANILYTSIKNIMNLMI